MTSTKPKKYCIQFHKASHDHYDLRLELDNVAKSWALPKEPPSKEGIKRLAIQVNDHDISYMDFEGVIPEGSYGAGSVKIWDTGTWDPESVKDNKIVAIINGKKLKGRYTLVKMKGNNWLFFKSKEK